MAREINRKARAAGYFDILEITDDDVRMKPEGSRVPAELDHHPRRAACATNRRVLRLRIDGWGAPRAIRVAHVLATGPSTPFVQ